MSSRINYAKLYTLRSDGRYQGKYKDADGKWHSVCDRDPEKLYQKLQELQSPPPRTFGDALEDWQTARESEIGWKTADAYKAPCKRLKEQFGADELGKVTPARIRAFLVLLGNQGYARRTVQMHRDIIHMVYQHEILLGNASESPTSAVAIPKGLTQTKREPPPDEAVAAVLAHPDAAFAPFAFLLMMTGLRRGEALALEQKDIDRERMVIHVTKSVEFEGNNPHIKPPKTESGIRDVHFPPALLPHLPTAPGLLFPMDGGKLMTFSSFRKRWAAYCTEIGHTFTPHQLRHYYASMLFSGDVDVLTAQAQLGHANVSTTMEVYTHLQQRKRAEGHAKIDDIFGK